MDRDAIRKALKNPDHDPVMPNVFAYVPDHPDPERNPFASSDATEYAANSERDRAQYIKPFDPSIVENAMKKHHQRVDKEREERHGRLTADLNSRVFGATSGPFGATTATSIQPARGATSQFQPSLSSASTNVAQAHSPTVSDTSKTLRLNPSPPLYDFLEDEPLKRIESPVRPILTNPPSVDFPAPPEPRWDFIRSARSSSLLPRNYATSRTDWIMEKIKEQLE